MTDKAGFSNPDPSSRSAAEETEIQPDPGMISVSFGACEKSTEMLEVWKQLLVWTDRGIPQMQWPKRLNNGESCSRFGELRVIADREVPGPTETEKDEESVKPGSSMVVR